MVSLLDTQRYGDDKRCLVAAYRFPVERIAINPVEFRGRLEYRDKGAILATLQNYFTNNCKVPSPLIQTSDFNRNSPLRKIAGVR